MWRRFRSLFRVLTRRHDFEEHMSEELRFHLEEYTHELTRSGVPPAEAARRARMEFSLQSVKGECREALGLHLFDEFLREVSHAARLLRKTPGFTLTALLTLAVCLGANLTIFAAIDSVLLRPLPFPEPGRLMTIFNSYPKAGVERDGASVTNYYERRGQIPTVSSLAIYRFGTAITGDAGTTVREPVARVSAEFFSLLGTAPAMGRDFLEEESTHQTDRVAILSDGYWRQRYSADPQVLGKQIRVDGLPRTVIGVLPASYRFLSSEARLYFPLTSRPEDRTPAQRHSGGNVTQMIARLKPGATVAQVQEQIDAQNARLESDGGAQSKMMADAGFRSIVAPLHEDHVAAIRPTLLMLQAGVLVLLAIGAVNLVNLLQIRANGRVKEVAVRQALGASRGHVVSEVVVETTFLTLAGGLLGLAAGAGGIRLLSGLGVDRLPLGSRIAFDARLALAGLAAAVVMGVVLAAPIAWLHLRRQPGNGIQAESRWGTSGRAVQTLRHGFIVSQIALAFMLLAGAGMLGLSLNRAMGVSPGFRSDRILTGQISLPWKNYRDGAARLAFVERLMDELGRLPGAMSAGVASNLPLSGNSGKSAAKVKGRSLRPGESPRGHYSYWVGGDYFAAMGIPLRAGRFLTPADSRRGQRVCVVDEDFARYYWPDASPLGQLLFHGSEERSDAEAFTVVGVTGRVKQAGMTDDTPQGAIYYPYVFRTDNDLFVAARSGLRAESLGPALERAVRRIDADLPVNDLRPMEARIADSLTVRRTPALLAGLFSGIALLLTAVGSYGVLSYAVAQRRREIGVRMALGARPEQIRGHFFSLALRLLACGTMLGAVGAWMAGRAMQTVLFQVPALYWPVLGAAACILAAVTVAACLLPARRAARTSPLEALCDR